MGNLPASRGLKVSHPTLQMTLCGHTVCQHDYALYCKAETESEWLAWGYLGREIPVAKIEKQAVTQYKNSK